MKLQNLLDTPDDERAVSPVIGVILMVAITVILAAVIGTFVLGLGDSVESAPQASFDFTANSSDSIDIEHRGGDTLDNSTVEVRLNGTSPGDGSRVINGTFRAGETVTVSPSNYPGSVNPGGQGASITIVTINGDRQNIVARYEVPE